MLAIRLQRTGRKGHAQYRMIVQDARRSPTSGQVVARLGRFNPHTKEVVIEKEQIDFYLKHGAQPSERVARLLKSEGVKLPKWVKLESKKARAIRNPEKLRKNAPAGTAAAEATKEDLVPPEEATNAEPAAEETTPSEDVAEANAEQKLEATDKSE